MTDQNLAKRVRTALRRRRGTAQRPSGYAHLMSRPEEWNAEYAAGRWECLGAVEQQAHYSVIVGYCQILKPNGVILDVGCGEGVLQQRLKTAGYKQYLGVDYADHAIARARGREDEHTRFVFADASVFTPESDYDVIVFNECLYYFKEPVDLVKRYEPYLSAQGLFIVSMCAGVASRFVWSMLGAFYAVVDATRVSQSGVDWTIKVMSPKSAEEQQA